MSTSKAPTAPGLGSEQQWHAQAVAEVLTTLGTTNTGLSEKEVKKRKKQIGANQFSEQKQPGALYRLLVQLKSPLTAVLVVAFLITLALGEHIDAIVIALALLIAVVVGSIQEGKASQAFKKLADSQEHIAVVVRAGKRHQVNSSELVPGDIVILQSGMQVPADLRLLSAKRLSINEATLTGEWLAVDKKPNLIEVGQPFAERSNMAWMGTFVAEGIGEGVVVETGDRTAVGKLAEGLRDVVEVETPLQVEMRRVSSIMLYLILFLVAVIFLVGILEGQSIKEMLLMSIAIAVASIPEGLPAAVTIILAVGMEALLRRGGLVRSLLAAETLGSTTFVLTDKTGTLTEGKMAITGLVFDRSMRSDAETWTNDAAMVDLFNVALLGTDAFYDEDAKLFRGDPVETAILHCAINVGVDSDNNSYRAKRVDFLPFSSEQRFAAGLAPLDDGFILGVNGAPSFLLRHATRYKGVHGIHELTDEIRHHYTELIKAETSQGKRLVAVAFKDVKYDDIPDDGSGVMESLIFAGVLVLTDPVREGVEAAIAGVKSAGARVLLITGDNAETAGSIAATVGIAPVGSQVITGTDLKQYTDVEVEALIDGGVSVFARILPQQKLRIAQLLQKRGEIVAMTGDGINDAPALRKANIGIAIGSGTEVAKESSDLVLVNDTFATIYAAIEEGRRVTSNLKKIVGYLLSTSLSEVVLIGAALLTGAPAPITAAQILWANIIEEGFMSVAFAFEKGDKRLMQESPQDIHAEGILSRDMLWFMGFVITTLSVLTLSLYFYLRSLGVPFEELRSAMFLSISLDSLFIAFAFRSLRRPVWQISLTSNLFFVGSFIVSALLLTLVITVPFMQTFLHYTPLPLYDMALVLGVSLASLLTIEFGKLVFFRHAK